MKNKLSRILGIGLTVAVLASMLVIANPGTASAAAMSFSGEFMAPTNPGTIIDDMAVAPNGTTIYAAGGGSDMSLAPGQQLLLKSTTSGAMWAGAAVPDQSPAVIGNLPATMNMLNGCLNKVAVAPDTADGSFVAVLAVDNTTAIKVLVSEDGGTTWNDTGFATAFPGVTLNDIAVAQATSVASHTIAVVGTVGGAAKVYLYERGGWAGGWVDATSAAWNYPGDFNTSSTTALAVAFSPNYNTDFTVAVVTANSTSTQVQLGNANTLSKKWNGVLYGWGTGAAAGAKLVDFVATGADIALAPAFFGGDPTARTLYVGLSGPGAGLYRVTDSIAGPTKASLGLLALTSTGIYSVALNSAGDKLVAGDNAASIVYRVASPATAPAIPVALAVNGLYKGPGAAAGPVEVAYAGTNVVAGTQGAEAAFSRSVDDGISFNDISLVNTTTANQVDFAVPADASTVYVATINGANTMASLWRKTTGWERILAVPVAGVTDYLIRLAPENASVVYFAEKGGANAYYYYTNDAGATTWRRYQAPAAVADMAVESASVVYTLGGNNVYQSSGGFVWNSIRTNSFTGNSIVCLGAGNLLVGGTAGNVAYKTTAGNWTALMAPIGGLGPVIATASGLASGNYIYATSVGNTNVYRWTVGTGMAWDAMYGIGGAFPNGTARGIAYAGNVLYVLTDNTTASFVYRTLSPSIAAAGFFWSGMKAEDVSAPFHSVVAPATMRFMATPGALVATVGADKNPKLWAIDTAEGLKSFIDVLTTASPTMVGPVDKFEDPINVETGKANDIVFQWTPPKDAPMTATYNLQIALDSAFTQVIYGGFGHTALGGVMVMIGPNQAAPNSFNYQADTTYYWRICVEAPLFSPFQTTPRSFRVGALAPLKLSSPASGATNVPVKPTFVWTPMTGATTYEIDVSDLADFSIVTFSHTSTQPIYASDEQLAYNTVYYWRVKATAPADRVTPFVTGVFTTEMRPTTPPPPITITQEAPPTYTITIPPSPEVIPAYLLWIIIGIGAILVIALIVLIVRTRRVS